MHKTILYSVLFFSILFPLQRVWAESKKKPDSSSLSLEEAIETTLRQNPELEAMQKDVDAAHAKIPQARQAFETASFAYTVGKSDFIVFLTATHSLFDAKMKYWKSYESFA